MTAGLVQVKKTWAGGRVEPGSEDLRQRAADSLSDGCMWESQRHPSPGSLATVDIASGLMWMEHRDAAVGAAVVVAVDDDLQCSISHCQRADTCQQATDVRRCLTMLSESPYFLIRK